MDDKLRWVSLVSFFFFFSSNINDPLLDQVSNIAALALITFVVTK